MQALGVESFAVGAGTGTLLYAARPNGLEGLQRLDITTSVFVWPGVPKDRAVAVASQSPLCEDESAKIRTRRQGTLHWNE